MGGMTLSAAQTSAKAGVEERYLSKRMLLAAKIETSKEVSPHDFQDPITGLYVDIARGADYYDWVGFVATGGGNVELLTSAIDFAGGPMIVGGGSAVPEPSGVLLVLLGLSAIALRRHPSVGTPRKPWKTVGAFASAHRTMMK